MIHAKDDGNTLLHFASRVGNMLMIRRLLQQGEDINAKNRAGQTALDIRVGAGAAGLSARARHPLSTHAAPTFQGSVLLKNPKAERATLLKVWVFFHNFEDPAV